MLLLIILKIYPNSPWAQKVLKKFRLRGDHGDELACDSRLRGSQLETKCVPNQLHHAAPKSRPMETCHQTIRNMLSGRKFLLEKCSSCFIVLCLVFISPRNGTGWWENIAELLGKATLHWSKTWRSAEGLPGYSLAMVGSNTGLGDLERIERYRI
jgi:hypothetical protein